MKWTTANERSTRKKGVWSTAQDGRTGSELVGALIVNTHPMSSTCAVSQKEIYNDATTSQSAGEQGPQDGQINNQSFAVGTFDVGTESRLPNSKSIATLPPSTRHAIR